jgi:hypothetical protein
MDWTLEFQGSEVQLTEGLGPQLRLVLSAASVHRAIGPLTSDVERGYLKSVEVVFSDTSWVGELPLCMGTLADGSIVIGDARLAQVPLPFSASTPVSAEFSFRSGAVLRVTALAVHCGCPGEPRFIESYAC